MDVFVSAMRQNKVKFVVPNLPDKVVNGERYADPWSGYTVQPDVLVSSHAYTLDSSNCLV